MDYHNILGVGPTANDEDIRKAYRKLAMTWHPDRNPGNDEALKKFKEIQFAYDSLMGRVKPRHSYTPPPKKEPPAKKEKPKKPVRKDFSIYDAPPPRFDIWGKPLTKRQQEEWIRNNSTNVVKLAKDKKQDFAGEQFIDIWSYEGGAQPDIR